MCGKLEAPRSFRTTEVQSARGVWEKWTGEGRSAGSSSLATFTEFSGALYTPTPLPLYLHLNLFAYYCP